MNRFNSLKLVQHFDVRKSNRKKEKEKKKNVHIQFTTFQNTSNIKIFRKLMSAFSPISQVGFK